ncbi:hypothetical protein [Streptomyces sp. NPDC058326]|uniref:hypothetical protein n=1 Tax=Streptomyces sp. NPDC058326 TaxID=3346447 RepID=UPI0036EA577D
MEREIADSLQTRWLRFVAGEGEHWKVPSPTALPFDLDELGILLFILVGCSSWSARTS